LQHKRDRSYGRLKIIVCGRHSPPCGRHGLLLGPLSFVAVDDYTTAWHGPVSIISATATFSAKENHYLCVPCRRRCMLAVEYWYINVVNWVLLLLRFRVASYHRLRGSASPVLTATHHSYGSLKLSDFFPAHAWRSDPQPILTQNGSIDVDSRKDVPFAVKIATFHTP